jgi:YD repeat-containing protein
MAEEMAPARITPMPTDDRVLDLLLRYEEALSKGQPLTAEELCRDSPQLLDEVKRRLDALRAVDVLIATTPTAPPTEALVPSVPGYEILGELGRGGMGVVYKARQLNLNRIVALKMVLTGAHAGPDERARFRAEAEAVARLQHPNIVQIHETGEHDRLPFFALEYVEGGSLARRLNGKPLPARAAAQLVEALARGVDAAHRRGVVHRDLKPGNVLLGADGTPKITDFGLAKQVDGQASLTPTGAILGTPNYMAPEQARGQTHEVGPAADIHALGAILYECLTGKPPFGGKTPLDTLQQVLTEEPKPPSHAGPKVPRDLETICLKCLHKEPARRYASALELAEDLRRFLAGEPVLARPVSRLRRWARRRRRSVAAGIVAGVLLLLSALAGWWYWDSRLRVKVEYYANTVRRGGANEGVGRLTPEQVRLRPVSYKLYRRGGRVEAVDIVNSRDRLTTKHTADTLIKGQAVGGARQRVCRYEFKRDERGQVTDQVALDRTGQTVWAFHFNTPTTGNYLDKHGYVRARSGSGAAYVEFTFDQRGFEKAVRFFDQERNPQPDAEGKFGWDAEFDERGLVVQRTHVGSDGRPTPHRDGHVQARFRYDALGNMVEAVLLDARGKPVMGREGYARLTRDYDENGNLLDMAWFDAEDRPALLSAGISRIRLTLDEGGNIATIVYLGKASRPTLHKDGYARLVRRHDSDGNIIEEETFGLDGRPALNANGFARVTAVYDEDGNILERAYFGRDGKPTLHRMGYARVTQGYDERGHETERACWGPHGKLTLYRDGYARATMKYDRRGNLTEQDFWGRDGRPAVVKDGYARATYEYDGRGNVTAIAFFDRGGHPTWHRNGYARLTRAYDSNGRQREQAYFGPDGRPTLHKDGYARMTWAHDLRGNPVEMAQFGLDGRLTQDRQGRMRTKARHDARGNLLELINCGPNGTRCRVAAGYARLVAEYDAHGRRTRERTFDIDDRPIRNKQGFAIWEATYDPRGNRTSESLFDEKGHPVLRQPSGSARWTTRYDEHGRPKERAYFDRAGRRATGHQRFSRTTWKYDGRGNVVERAFFDTRDRPVLNHEGLARWTAEYDERGRQVLIRFFDEKGRPTSEYAQERKRYDERGNLVGVAFLDAAGKLVRTSRGHARRREWYDERSNCIRVAFYDVNGKLTRNSAGFATVERRYDERGNRIEVAYFDEKGRPTKDWAREKRKYDDRGNALEVLNLDGAGKPVLTSRGYHRAVYTFDGQNNLIDVAFFDTKGRWVPTVVRILSVEAGRQGARKGLRRGDLIVQYDGMAVVNSARFIHQRSLEPPGSPARELVVLRGKQRLTVSIAPGMLGVRMESVVAPKPR